VPLAKFTNLSEPALGGVPTATLAAAILDIDGLESVSKLFDLGAKLDV
jgi:hypothetical protein